MHIRPSQTTFINLELKFFSEIMYVSVECLQNNWAALPGTQTKSHKAEWSTLRLLVRSAPGIQRTIFYTEGGAQFRGQLVLTHIEQRRLGI